MEKTEGAGRPAGGRADERQSLLHVLAAATFLIFFQAFMIAPLLPALAKIFSTVREDREAWDGREAEELEAWEGH